MTRPAFASVGFPSDFSASSPRSRLVEFDGENTTGGGCEVRHPHRGHVVRWICRAFRAVAEVPDHGSAANARRKTESAGAHSADGRRQAGPLWNLGHRTQQTVSAGGLRGYGSRTGVRQHRVEPQGRFAVSTVGGGGAEVTVGRKWERRPVLALSASMRGEIAYVAPAQKDHPASGARRHSARSQCGLSADLHGWPSAAHYRAAVVQRLLNRKM